MGLGADRRRRSRGGMHAPNVQPTAEVLGDTAYTVGFEHTSASVNGFPTTYTLRHADLLS